MKGGYWWCTAANKTSHCCLLTSGAGRDVLAPLVATAIYYTMGSYSWKNFVKTPVLQ